VDNKIGNVLMDFEDYSMVVRKGGTDSKLRNTGEESKTNKDEDIRQMAVQEVSLYISLINHYLTLVPERNCNRSSEESVCCPN
jgi:hypothetical protein